VKRLSVAAALLGTAGLVAALVARYVRDDEPKTLAGHGLSVQLPGGWEGQVLPPRPPARPGPVLRAAATAGGALVVLRDATSLYAPLGSPLGFPRARRPPAATSMRFRAGGRFFDQVVEATPETLEDAKALLASLTIRPLTRRPPGLPRVRMQATPVLAQRVCRTSRLLRPICPTRVRAGVYPRSGLFVSPISRPGDRYDVFELNGRPAPARRLVLLASRYGLGRQALAGWARLERARAVGLRSDLTSRKRSAPLVVSAVRWGDREGMLVLEDTDGGPLEDHLVFRWRRRGIDHAAAIRAWEPLHETAAALRAIVLSIPR
jgi:hypothetical protein